MTYPCYWLKLLPAQQEWLAQFWLALIPHEVVRSTTSMALARTAAQHDERAKAALRALVTAVQRVNAMPPYLLHPDVWPSALVTAAYLVGFEKVRIFVDDLESKPSTQDIATMLRWRDAQIDLFLLTASADIATVDGMRAVSLTWDAPRLWKMAMHRLAQFANPPEDTVGRKAQAGGYTEVFQPLPPDLPADLASWIECQL